MKPNTRTLHCVVHEELSQYYTDSMSYFRSAAIEAFLQSSGNGRTWDYWNKKCGFSCIKVSITIQPIEQ